MRQKRRFINWFSTLESRELLDFLKFEKLSKLFTKDNLASLFKGRRGYITYLVIACAVTIVTVVSVSKLIQARRDASLYREGQKALAEKNYDKAIEDFSKLFKDDPGYKDVGKKLAEAINKRANARAASSQSGSGSSALGTSFGQATSGASGSASGSGGTSSAAAGGAVSGGGSPSGGNSTGSSSSPGSSGGGQIPPEVKKLVDLLPGSFTGYETMGTQTGPNFASRGYVPRDREKIGNLLITIHDRATSEGAQAFVQNVTKKAFGTGGKSVDVKGKQAYFGTDGRVNASLAWEDGHIVYELVMMSTQNQPADLEDALIWAANQFYTP